MVSERDIRDIKTSGDEQIQGMSTGVSGNVDRLRESKTVQQRDKVGHSVHSRRGERVSMLCPGDPDVRNEASSSHWRLPQLRLPLDVWPLDGWRLERLAF